MNWYVGLDFSKPFQSDYRPFGTYRVASELEGWKLLKQNSEAQVIRAESQANYHRALVDTATKRIEELTNG